MPESTGITLTRDIHAASPDTELLIFTMNESDEMVRALTDAGARGYLLKDNADEELENAIRSVAAGRPFFSRVIADTLLEEHVHVMRKQGVTDSYKLLTEREREVLDGVVAGRLNKQIAGDLGITEKTVKVHRARVMVKMEADSLVQLVRFADRIGLRRS